MYIKHLIIAAIATCALTAAAQPKGTTEYPLPEGVVSVTPPQGLVNLLGPHNGDDIGAYPTGCRQIGVFFGKRIAANSDFKGKIAIYKDGATTPEEEVGAENVSYDSMTGTTGSIYFNREYKENGVYRIYIPENAWIINPVFTSVEIDGFWYDTYAPGPDSSFSPAIELEYEIFNCAKVYPQPSVLKDFDDFKFVFEGATEVTFNEGGKMRWIGGANNPEYDSTCTVEINGNVANFRPTGGSPTIDDNYYLSVMPGAFTIKYPGGVTYESEKMYLHYGITNVYPRPEVFPAEGEIDGFHTIVLTLDKGNQLLLPNDKSKYAGLYPVYDDGTISVNPVCVFRPAKLSNYEIAFEACHWLTQEPYMEPFVPAPGEYVFNPLDYNYEFDGGANLQGYNYHYTVLKSSEGPLTGIEAIAAEGVSVEGNNIVAPANAEVYTLSGIRCAKNDLAPGIYIVRLADTAVKVAIR